MKSFLIISGIFYHIIFYSKTNGYFVLDLLASISQYGVSQPEKENFYGS